MPTCDLAVWAEMTRGFILRPCLSAQNSPSGRCWNPANFSALGAEQRGCARGPRPYPDSVSLNAGFAFPGAEC